MAWDSKGNLYIATGDNNSSGFSDGYSGNNPEPNYKGVSFADARRTAGNTNNLNGKILRIHPEADGTYTLPAGNLFTGKETDEGGGKTRGEIYVMGVRNPARISVDKKTDILYAGWVGPDAGAPSHHLGPGEVRHVRRHHQGGQPRLAVLHGQQAALPGPQSARPDASRWAGTTATHPKNESPNNDGLVNLPPVTGNTIWYSPQGGGPDYPRDANGIPSYKAEEAEVPAAVAQGRRPGDHERPGLPVRRARAPATAKWPAYWDGKWFVGDFYDADQPRHAVLTDPKTVGQGRTARARRVAEEDHPGRQRRHPQPHGLEVRPGRLAVRPRLRARLLHLRRQVRAVARDLQGRRADPGRRPAGQEGGAVRHVDGADRRLWAALLAALLMVLGLTSTAAYGAGRRRRRGRRPPPRCSPGPRATTSTSTLSAPDDGGGRARRRSSSRTARRPATPRACRTR